MIPLQSKLIFGQLNSISPQLYYVKNGSVADDFAFISRMFSKVGNDIQTGINYVKSDYKK